jgi:glycosyltransferase involved in cell wall biosynthesis
VEAAAENPDVELRIAGTGPELAPLRARAAGAANVSFLGQLDLEGLRAERARAWATLAPSRWLENAPMSVIESWWEGRATIVAAHGGLAEMVEDGSNGWSVAPSDPRAWSAAFSRAAHAHDELLRMGEAARARAEREHSFEDYLDRVLELYRSAIEAAGGRR